MNYKMMGRFIAYTLYIEAIFMIPAAIICLIDREMDVLLAFGITIAIAAALATPLLVLGRKAQSGFYSLEGMVCVSLCWIVLSLVGCLPFVISGQIPHYIDALFEIVSGFTTTGASILRDVEALSRGLLYWRSFSHWLGGMGVLVFLLALLPAASKKSSGFTMHLLRAESPGPDVSKLVPHMRQTAIWLYATYVILTVADIIFLLIGGMPLFDALCTAFGTAGTGGFGIKNDSLAGYSPYIQVVTTVFMLLFGVNFSCYFLLYRRQWRDLLKDEELRVYFGVILGSIIIIAWNVFDAYTSAGETIRHAAFQVASIITTTGYATTDFNLWPSLSKAIIMILMVIGAMAGSTGGGLKCARVLLLFKSIRQNIRQALHPQEVRVVRVSGRPVSDKLLHNTCVYFAVYFIIMAISFVLISFDGFSITTNLTAVVSCFNNIGPGLDQIGPVSNYADYSYFSKIVLTLDMLLGRLEIFPMLALFAKDLWRSPKANRIKAQ